MNFLAIETSTEHATVALSIGGRIYGESQNELRQHAQFILPIIDRLLKAADLSLKQLDGIVFGQGPGSFTGLRISCSVAKGLAYAHDLPLYPVSGLASIAWDAFNQTQGNIAGANVLAIIDARMQQVYWGHFVQNIFIAHEQVNAPEHLMVPAETPLILAGVGVGQYGAQLPEALKQRIIAQYPLIPNAQSMIKLVQSGQFEPVSAAQAEPVYIRNQVTQGAPRG